MRPGGGKNKGGSFERLVAVQLSLWLSKGTLKDAVVRSEGSGARFTSTAKRGASTGTAGDLMPKALEALAFFNQYVCECKFWKDLNLVQFLQCEGELYKALLKVQEEANSMGKNWLLISKQNGRNICVFLPAADHLPYMLPEGTITHSLFNGTVCMCQFEELLKIPIDGLFEAKEKV